MKECYWVEKLGQNSVDKMAKNLVEWKAVKKESKRVEMTVHEKVVLMAMMLEISKVGKKVVQKESWKVVPTVVQKDHCLAVK